MVSTRENDKAIIAQTVKGVVKWFNVKAGYGFITCNDDNKDVFVHKISIVTPNSSHVVPSLADNEEVQFDLVGSEKGLEAINVTGPGGNSLLGNPHVPRRAKRGRGGGYNPSWSPNGRGTFRPFVRGNNVNGFRGGSGGGGGNESRGFMHNRGRPDWNSQEMGDPRGTRGGMNSGRGFRGAPRYRQPYRRGFRGE